MREALRGRAALLVVDRTDIVDAAEADGVLLSPKGAVRLGPLTEVCAAKAQLMADMPTLTTQHCCQVLVSQCPRNDDTVCLFDSSQGSVPSPVSTLHAGV